MAVMCARCGAQNPDGNVFCQACGSQLAAPAPGGVATAVIPGPPPGPPPAFAPPAYQSPYYTPTGPPVAVHRTPWTLIVGAVVALIVVMAGGGTVLALLANHSNSTASTDTRTGIGSAVPSPSPGVTPSPVASPVSTSATTESNAGVTVPVPIGWTVQSKDNESIILTDPDGTGAITVASGPSSPPQTALQNKAQIDDYLKQNYPDARSCPNTTTANTTFSGAAGISWVMCFTVTSGGQTAAGAASLFVGANSSGDVYYLVMVVTRQSNLATFLSVAKPVLDGVRWKLS